ncbi:MAG: DUF998 domain-containing protein [Methanomassiliicoccaceae archaeon]|nr:DUF998 domain-containing protein [Methanomassiliicoccaceae archaeon]
MELMKERNLLIGASALSATVVFALCWFIAAMSDTAWIFGANYLSDLGVSDYEYARMFFNGGCLIAGILFAICGAAILTSKRNKLDAVAGVVAVAAGVSIALIGVFTSDSGSLHLYIAYAAFGAGMVCLLLLAMRDWSDEMRKLATFAFMSVSFVAALYYVLVHEGTDIGFLSGMPGVETAAAVVLLLLFFLQSAKFMYRGGVKRATPNGKGIAERHRVALGFAGILSALMFLSFWLFAMLSDPSWAFNVDPVYMLGLSSAEDVKLYFSIGCLAGGAFAIMYGAGVTTMQRGYLRSSAGVFVTIIGIILLIAGILFLTTGEVSECMETVALIFGVAALICIIISDWKKEKMLTAAFYLFMLVIVGTHMLISGPGSDVSVSVLALFALLGVEGVRLIAGK